MFEQYNISINENEFLVRIIQPSDYYKNYIHLLKQLSQVDYNLINYNIFEQFINSLHDKHQIIVIENIKTNMIIGTITILIETKIIHNMRNVCHIEDLVVEKIFNGLGIGKLLLSEANKYAIKSNCYKSILDCSNDNITFYVKNKFECKGNQMALYH